MKLGWDSPAAAGGHGGSVPLSPRGHAVERERADTAGGQAAAHMGLPQLPAHRHALPEVLLCTEPPRLFAMHSNQVLFKYLFCLCQIVVQNLWGH